MLALLGGDTSSPGLEITGSEAVLPALLGVITAGDPAFNIILP